MGAARFDGGGGVAVPREHWPRRPGDTISTKERENGLKSEILKNEMKNQCLFAAAILADRTPSARKWRNYFVCGGCFSFKLGNHCRCFYGCPLSLPMPSNDTVGHFVVFYKWRPIILQAPHRVRCELDWNVQVHYLSLVSAFIFSFLFFSIFSFAPQRLVCPII